MYNLRCICIKDREIKYGSWIKGEIYEYFFVSDPDRNFGLDRPWAVYHKKGLSRLTESDFKEHFVDIIEMREEKINKLCGI